MFTLNRINVKFKHQYILDISQEMRQAESDHELDKSLFSDMNRKRLDMLMANPEAFYHWNVLVEQQIWKDVLLNWKILPQ